MPFFSFGPEGRKQFEQFGRVSTLGLELGLSIALGFWGGQWLDRKFGTGGWLTWVGFALGLTAGVRSLYVLVRRTQAELSKTDPEGSLDDSTPDLDSPDDAPESPSDQSPPDQPPPDSP
ncbi:MAG: AtpZ/AtpI family protein [Deltaproteobacteria bacterium]|nr:AtpZ/AtpI family protein [Deltaproteobacteria bacterium]